MLLIDTDFFAAEGSFLSRQIVTKRNKKITTADAEFLIIFSKFYVQPWDAHPFHISLKYYYECLQRIQDCYYKIEICALQMNRKQFVPMLMYSETDEKWHSCRKN